MTKGKPWSVDEERKLKKMFEAGKSLLVMASSLEKTKEAVRQKIMSLGWKQQQRGKKGSCCSSNLEVPDDLPTVEEALKKLSGALKALEQPGLDQSEILRLRSIIQGVKIYKEVFADFVDYRGIEAELVELRRGYDDLIKKAQNDAVAPDRK